MSNTSSQGANPPRPWARVYLSLGANLGQRRRAIDDALAALDETPGVRVRTVSPYYETVPAGPVAQPAFVNAAAEIETALGPLELLSEIKALEKRLGRTPSERWGPRAIDIDIVLWEGVVLDSEALTLPHPRYRERAFVLVPLADAAPSAADPRTGETAAELAARPGLDGAVLRIAPPDDI